MSLENLSLEARDELAALAQTLAENPETRKDFLRMTKRVKPDLPIPELDIEDYTHTVRSAVRKTVCKPWKPSCVRKKQLKNFKSADSL
jgi:hypothetical protein